MFCDDTILTTVLSIVVPAFPELWHEVIWSAGLSVLAADHWNWLLLLLILWPQFGNRLTEVYMDSSIVYQHVIHF